MIGWTTVGKIGLKIAKGIAIAACVGYVDYRMKGGKPIRQVYREVKASRISEPGCKVVDRTDEIVEKLKKAKYCGV